MIDAKRLGGGSSSRNAYDVVTTKNYNNAFANFKMVDKTGYFTYKPNERGPYGVQDLSSAARLGTATGLTLAAARKAQNGQGARQLSKDASLPIFLRVGGGSSRGLLSNVEINKLYAPRFCTFYLFNF